MQLKEGTARDVLMKHSAPGITIAGVPGDQDSESFTGDVAQNLYVGSSYLEDLLYRVKEHYPRKQKDNRPAPEPGNIIARSHSSFLVRNSQP
jgi:hypothetical protein